MTFILTVVIMGAVFGYGYSCGLRDADRRAIRASKDARRRRHARERGLSPKRLRVPIQDSDPATPMKEMAS